MDGGRESIHNDEDCFVINTDIITLEKAIYDIHSFISVYQYHRFAQWKRLSGRTL